MKEIITKHDVIPPGKFLHYVFRVESTAPLDVSVIDRDDITAEAVLDSEGWCVIVLTNVVDVPVTISHVEPLRLVITPSRQTAVGAVDACPAKSQK